MTLLERLRGIWAGVEHPFLVHQTGELAFSDVASQRPLDLSSVGRGDVVAVIGDFDPATILTLLRLIDAGAIVVPLTTHTTPDHEYFFASAGVDAVISDGVIRRRAHDQPHELIAALRAQGHAGLILFSTGTTGRPKAILHDLTLFLKRFETPRPSLRTLNFLLFDHIGGINTLLHTLFNRGVVVAPGERSVSAILDACRRHAVEVLPATPTFLRMLLLSGAVPQMIPASLGLITYGTERMDQATLDALCAMLPNVDFRQTYGTSELGIVRVKSAARNSLFMRVGGEGISTRIVDNVLHIRSEFRMLGYLNAPSPFDAQGWYDTKDVVEEKDGCFRIVGRLSDAINVGGLKFMASDVERVALDFPGVMLVSAHARHNPITGQHVELTVQPATGVTIERAALMDFLKARLQPQMMPSRVRIGDVHVGHRFKKE